VNDKSISQISQGAQQNKPLITVVTVVFNGAKFLENTIQSVINQTYSNIEYIIIDGCSTDGTLDVIEKYRDEISWVSEHDKGIYDAMNKGIAMANGKWINFMNAGDSFYSLSTIADVFVGNNYDEDVLFGNVNILYPEFSKIKSAGNSKNLWRGMQFCHQSVFVRTVIQKQNLFNVSSLSADFQFFYNLHESNSNFKHIDFLTASVIVGGVSDLNRVEVIEEWRNTVCSEGCNIGVKIYYKCFKIIVSVIGVLKHLLPKIIINSIIKSKR
jgi:glycosyltransferase involved in cell wall biosynthesis